MVGIILASHGEFAEGILQSGSMIFGEQENVKAITLMPSEGPEDVKTKMKTAIASFDDQDEVLFLVDLWGGTPFNQANTLFEEHKEKWAIVAGLNLPMVIEAYASRLSMNSAQEIAAHIIETAKEGVKVRPEELEPVTNTSAAAAAPVQGSIPPGTVVGDGKIKLGLVRVDSRLLHGQVATAWTKSVLPNRIIIVSDAVAKDDLRKRLIEQAAPPGVKANVVPIDKMIEITKDPRFGGTKALLLFENPQDVIRVMDGGVEIKEVNVGSMAHSVGKVVVSKVLSMGPEDVKAFEEMKQRGVKFDVRKVPNDSGANMNEIIKKAKNELARA
ncbi:mannose/fructose/sorbose PTS transporter subunit IIA [Carnobacterium viridans]|uniref:PTS system mannose-specific EIIAB component n=1 Tax=Carnobacterium viridans TaxID=174587 RepID=A0A1H1AXR7_9LACT|nr:mannose/fructose/sorbose PTS transporter subunit IIA [Carnobacterium viridans]UDE96010.1 mannose/fructose/sorbose PTS transporter subunit IIA [Carnobacterium viridans]SDQ44450.1 PTS system, mannose-specific IIB component [Carnobacterium viridans]